MPTKRFSEFLSIFSVEIILNGCLLTLDFSIVIQKRFWETLNILFGFENHMSCWIKYSIIIFWQISQLEFLWLLTIILHEYCLRELFFSEEQSPRGFFFQSFQRKKLRTAISNERISCPIKRQRSEDYLSG